MNTKNDISADALFARQPRTLTQKLNKACVGIAGAGGLGTVVAENLARAGIGSLVIADYDIVEPSNLNRQRYTIAQLGKPKASTLAENIRSFNPYVDVTALEQKVTAANCAHIFAGCLIVAECFDAAESKAALVSGLRKNLPECIIVAASGLAGTGNGNTITTHKMSDNVYVIGDLKSDADKGLGLLASRVGIAASMQAHTIIRLIIGEQL